MTEREPARNQPLCLLIAALGGEGGGVLMNWIVACARQAGHAVQATSVPGVAQRSGSTSYYIEIMPGTKPGDAPPVFALVPMPGRIDVVAASELVEAARMMERGFVSPKRTTLITSQSRFYTTAEKVQMGDGRFDGARVTAAAEKLAKRTIAHDFDAIARDNGTLVSAALFGAMAGAGLLPWSRGICEAVIGSGRSNAASRAGFAAAFDAVLATDTAAAAPAPVIAAAQPIEPHDAIEALPSHLRDVARHGFDRVVDFQDRTYGDLYLTRLRRITAAAGNASPEQATIANHASTEAARRLALWMAYEDVPRVADLKTRAERFARIRGEAQAKPGQIIEVVDYLKPGMEEIADMLPASLGARVAARHQQGKSLPFVGRGLHLKSSAITGYLILKALATARRWRPRSLRYLREQAAIDAWIADLERTLPRAPAFAAALAELPRLLKGYGDTHARGLANYSAINDRIVGPAIRAEAETAATATLRKAMAAALADPERVQLEKVIATAGVTAQA